MATAADYVTIDEHGVMRVGTTQLMLDSVLASFHAGVTVHALIHDLPSFQGVRSMFSDDACLDGGVFQPKNGPVPDP